MIIRRESEKQLKEYWGRRFPEQEQLTDRFSKVGLLLKDTNLAADVLVCACSLMVERRTIYEVHQAIDAYRRECIKSPFGESFFEELKVTIAELERGGMRSQAQRLRKLSQGIAKMQNETEWEKHWGREADRKRISAIKDEPFLPQRGQRNPWRGK